MTNFKTGPRKSWTARPASLMCTPGKLTETVISQIRSGCINMICMGEFKKDFIKEIPLLVNLWSSSKENVKKHLCERDPVNIVYSFQKAFEKVPDQKLLRKPNRHGIRI